MEEGYSNRELSSPEVTFTTAPKAVVACIERRGDYFGIGEDMLRLKNWIESKGIEQVGYPFCQYFDNPGETPLAALRSEACIPVKKEFPPEGEFKSKQLGEARVAQTRHNGNPEEFARTYGPFLEGLLKDGYGLIGPARESYRTVSEVKGPGSGFLIQQPISKK
jgi:DNA gyrase inhibitor GyrI